MNYRETYQDRLNISIPIGFDIHHLDLDHENNDFENLLMLPEYLHIKYHSLFPKMKDLTFNTDILSVCDSGYSHNLYFNDIFREFCQIHIECCKWLDFKNHLLGVLPNIHNINLEDYYD